MPESTKPERYARARQLGALWNGLARCGGLRADAAPRHPEPAAGRFQARHRRSLAVALIRIQRPPAAAGVATRLDPPAASARRTSGRSAAGRPYPRTASSRSDLSFRTEPYPASPSGRERLGQGRRKGDGSALAAGLSTQAIAEVVAAYAEPLGIDVAPHDCRRTFAKLALKGGARREQIQLSLGHASIRTTERYLGVEQDLADAPCHRLS